MSSSDRPQLNRRTVFAGAGTVGALAAAATLLPKAPTEVAQAPADRTAAPDADGRYQATAHVMRYYQTAKL